MHRPNPLRQPSKWALVLAFTFASAPAFASDYEICPTDLETHRNWAEHTIAGDFNGDGYEDLVVSNPGRCVPGSSVSFGEIEVYYGGHSGFEVSKTHNPKDFPSYGVWAGYGAAFAVGDFNGDGISDLAVAMTHHELDDGPGYYVQVYRGSQDGLVPSDQVRAGLGGSEPGDGYGHALAAGDFNGDGRDDLAVGVPFAQDWRWRRAGGVQVFFGEPWGLEFKTWVRRGGAKPREDNEMLGWALAAGDFDGDGVSDLAVGAPGDGIKDGRALGAAFVFRIGDLDSPVLMRKLVPPGSLADDPDFQFGLTMAAGDIHGDGYDELVVGSRDMSFARTKGLAFLYEHAQDSGFRWTATLEGIDAKPTKGGDGFSEQMLFRDLNHDGAGS